MPTPGLSLKSSLRKSIRDLTRARGHRNNNLWQDYSIKTDRDWVLPSDQQFIHWLYFLEANPEVVSFDLAPGVIISHDDDEQRGTELDAIATFRDGHVEWHEVKAGDLHLDIHQSQFKAQMNAAYEAGARYRIFNDVQLRPVSKVAMRWLHAFAYGKVLRSEEHTTVRSSLALYGRTHKVGTLAILLRDLNTIDPDVLLGMLVRMTVQGTFRLDLEEMPFGYKTRWFYEAESPI